MCSAVAIAGMLVWYQYCLKIYNSFKFVKQSRDWSKKDDDAVDDDDEGYHVNPLDKKLRGASKDSSKSSASTATAASDSSNNKGFLWFGGSKSSTQTTTVANTANTGNKDTYNTYSDNNYQNILYDGTVELKSQLYSKRNPLESDGGNKWFRRYIVLIDSHFIMFYNSQGEYKSSATSSLCKTYRPLDLTKYTHRVVKSADNNQDIILLNPLLQEDTLIELRCSNKADLDKLVTAISYFAQHANLKTVASIANNV